jgi:hypothetical protein
MNGGIGMKLGTLMVGGLLGAAAVIYFTKGKNSQLLSTTAGNSINKAMSKAKNTFGGKNQNPSLSANKFDSKSDKNLSDVKNIVEEDDKLHSQVEEILAEDGKSSAYATQ